MRRRPHAVAVSLENFSAGGKLSVRRVEPSVSEPPCATPSPLPSPPRGRGSPTGATAEASWKRKNAATQPAPSIASNFLKIPLENIRPIMAMEPESNGSGDLDRIMILPPRVPEGLNVNSRGRKPTDWCQYTFDPCGVELLGKPTTVGLHPRLFTLRRSAPCAERQCPDAPSGLSHTRAEGLGEGGCLTIFLANHSRSRLARKTPFLFGNTPSNTPGAATPKPELK